MSDSLPKIHSVESFLKSAGNSLRGLSGPRLLFNLPRLLKQISVKNFSNSIENLQVFQANLQQFLIWYVVPSYLGFTTFTIGFISYRPNCNWKHTLLANKSTFHIYSVASFDNFKLFVLGHSFCCWKLLRNSHPASEYSKVVDTSHSFLLVNFWGYGWRRFLHQHLLSLQFQCCILLFSPVLRIGFSLIHASSWPSAFTC